MMKPAPSQGGYEIELGQRLLKCFEVRECLLTSGLMIMFPNRISLSLKPIAWDEPQGAPEGMAGSIHVGCLIQPIWFCSDSIERRRANNPRFNFQVWEH